MPCSEGERRWWWPLALPIVLAAALRPGVAADEAIERDVRPRTAGYAKITGPIDRMRHRYLSRVIADARAAGLDVLIVHIDTDGGEVSYAREMFKEVLDQRHDGPRMVAFVDYRAISAGALIAYAHDALYMAESASIGDIGVIMRTAEGKIEYAPEKIETVIRSLLVQAAEQRGWSRGLLLKMTARNQNLYRVTLPDGSARFVIEDDLPELLARYPDLDREDPTRVILYRGEDRLLTLTGREALALGMASGTAPDVDALYAALGLVPASVSDLSPRPAEVTAWYLGSIAPLLAGLALLFIMFELKTPGVGIWALLGGLCAAAFLLAQYYLDMAENIEVVLIAAGVALIVLDVLTLSGGGLLALAGGLAAFAGLVLAFLPNEFDFDLTDERFLDALGDAALSGLLSVGIMVIGMLAFIALLPRTGLHRRLAVEAVVGGTSAGELEAAADSLVGRSGRAREALHPSGSVTIDGEHLSARAEHGTYVASGAAVVVVAVEFGEVVVRALPEDGAAGAP